MVLGKVLTRDCGQQALGAGNTVAWVYGNTVAWVYEVVFILSAGSVATTSLAGCCLIHNAMAKAVCVWSCMIEVWFISACAHSVHVTEALIDGS